MEVLDWVTDDSPWCLDFLWVFYLPLKSDFFFNIYFIGTKILVYCTLMVLLDLICISFLGVCSSSL